MSRADHHRFHVAFIGCALLALMLIAAATSVKAGVAPSLFLSSDITKKLGNLTVDDGEVAQVLDNGTASGIVFDGLPNGVGVDGYDDHPSKGAIVSFDSSVSISIGPFSVLVQPGDVVGLDGDGNYTGIVFRSTDYSVPLGANVDAVAWVVDSFQGLTAVAVSFDVPVFARSGNPSTHLLVEPRSMLCVDVDDASKYWICFDGAAGGAPFGSDIDAADHADHGGSLFNHSWYVSFTTSGTVDGTFYDDEDVLQRSFGGLSIPGVSPWGTFVNNSWAGADLDAFSVQFAAPPAATPTATSSATLTSTPTSTPSSTPTATPTQTTTGTVTMSVTSTATATATATPTHTATRSGTVTTTVTSTPTATPTHTATRSETVTMTATSTATATATNTGTVPTPVPTTATNTATATATSTGTVPTPTATPTGQPCASDCDGNGTVSINELVRAVNIALGRQGVDACPAADLDGNGSITINELIRAVADSLGRCS